METIDNTSLTHKLNIRNLNHTDYEDVRSIMEEAYSRMGGAWKETEIQTLLSIFPEGQLCIEDNGKVVSAALTLIIDYANLEHDHSYEDIVSG